MPKSLESKTIIGLLVLLGTAVGLVIAGKLTPEMVEVLKWVGAGFMTVRTAANVAENLPGNKKDG